MEEVDNDYRGRSSSVSSKRVIKAVFGREALTLCLGNLPSSKTSSINEIGRGLLFFVEASPYLIFGREALTLYLDNLPSALTSSYAPKPPQLPVLEDGLSSVSEHPAATWEPGIRTGTKKIKLVSHMGRYPTQNSFLRVPRKTN